MWIALLLVGCDGADGSQSAGAAPTPSTPTSSAAAGSLVFDDAGCPDGAMFEHSDPGEDFEGYET